MIISALSNNPQQENTSATIPNRSVYAIASPYRENLLAKEDSLVAGGTARPGTAGGSLQVSRFLPTRELTNNSSILHRTTSAKTRATATLRQLHIPPNVGDNSAGCESNICRASSLRHAAGFFPSLRDLERKVYEEKLN
jgi:hypothetical protein